MNVEFLIDKHIKGAYGAKGGNLRFDFIILQNGKPIKVIEVDGAQHFRIGGNRDFFNSKQKYEDRMLNDKYKEEFAIENNLPMLRLSYKLFRSAKKKTILKGILEEFIEQEASETIRIVS